jgi:hypothetical protein
VATWTVHARVVEHHHGKRTTKYTSRYEHVSPEYEETITVEASSPLQARVRGMAELRRMYPKGDIKLTSVHQESEDTEESEQE